MAVIKVFSSSGLETDVYAVRKCPQKYVIIKSSRFIV
jgi:hypothetical protein